MAKAAKKSVEKTVGVTRPTNAPSAKDVYFAHGVSALTGGPVWGASKDPAAAIKLLKENELREGYQITLFHPDGSREIVE